MQVVWQYHVEEPVSAAGVLPDHGAVRGSRPLYLVQRDAQPRRNSRNQEMEPLLKIWDILNKQVSRYLALFFLLYLYFSLSLTIIYHKLLRNGILSWIMKRNIITHLSPYRLLQHFWIYINYLLRCKKIKIVEQNSVQSHLTFKFSYIFIRHDLQVKLMWNMISAIKRYR